MYLWKCWRESRLFFILSAAYFVFLGWDCLWLYQHAGSVHPHHHHGPVVFAITGFLAIACVVAWYFGQTGVGRHFHQNAGDFFFTRPRTRRFFVWSEWGYGMALAALLLAVTAFWASVASHLRIAHMGSPQHDTVVSAASQFPVSEAMLLIALSVLLLAGILVGLAQLYSLLFRNGGYGLAAGLATVVIYVWASIWLPRHEDIHLPSLFFVSFHDHEHVLTLVPDFALQLLLRTALVLIFPLLTQLLLERFDI